MSEFMPGYYAIIPASVRYDDKIPAAAKLLYGEISALLNADGVCFASNAYFAELYKVSERTITAWISALKKGNYLIVQIDKDENGQIKQRRIHLTVSAVDGQPVEDFFYTHRKFFQGGIEENFQYTNISIKEINKESSTPPPTKKGNPPKTDFDPRPLFVSWIDAELPKLVPSGTHLAAKDKNVLYISLLNFSENRVAMKKPIPSKSAVVAILNRLVKYTACTPNRVADMIDLLETATSSGWLTVYKPKSQDSRVTKPQGGRVYEEL